MPTVDDYQALAPFSLDELVTAANAVLRDRPHVKVQVRTVRYYISEGFLNPPSGGPKFARYGMDHLRRLVQIRTWLDEGVSLAEAANRLGITRTPASPSRTSAHREPEMDLVLSAEPRAPSEGELVRRIALAPTITLEIQETGQIRAELERARQAIDRLLRR